jgi:hypothetical protein
VEIKPVSLEGAEESARNGLVRENDRKESDEMLRALSLLFFSSLRVGGH